MARTDKNMKRKKPSDEDLMALADEALGAKRRAEVLAMVEGDAALKARVELFRQSRALLGASLKPLADDEVPPELRKAIERMAGIEAAQPAAEILPFRQKTGKPAAWLSGSSAIAASVAAVLAGVAGYLIAANSTGSVDAGTLVAGANVPQAVSLSLATAPSGTEQQLDSGRLRLISSVMAGDGALCREFEIDNTANQQTVAAVACRRDGGWRLEAVVFAAAGSDGYAPASSLTVMDSYLQAIGAGEPLTPELEAKALNPPSGSSP